MVPFEVDARARTLLARAADNGWPLPDDDSSVSVLRWLGESGPRDPSGVSRYLTELWRERADLRETFPGIPFDRSQRNAFLRWATVFAAEESSVHPGLLDFPLDDLPANHDTPGEGETVPRRPRHPSAVATVVGFFRAQLGLASAARRMVTLCRLAMGDVQAIPYDHVGVPLVVHWPDVALEDLRPTEVTILCVNGTELPRLYRALGDDLLSGTYRVGLWFWELEVLSDAMAVGFAHLDEVWVTSTFVADAVRAALRDRDLDIPVGVVPLGVDLGDGLPGSAPLLAAEALGLPGGVMVGCSFDFGSTIERKNPIGAIEAFRRAFPTPFELGETLGPRLVLKCHGGSEYADARASVAAAIQWRPDIVVVDRNFSEAQQHDFYRHLSAFISLHRSEGYGLGPLEAMANGVATIATDYSGNLAYMTPSNSWLVNAGRSMVPPSTGGYIDGAPWAEPDLADASVKLRYVIVRRHDTDVRTRAEQGRRDVTTLVSGEAGAGWIRARIAAIRSNS